jgi:hypothetical protein
MDTQQIEAPFSKLTIKADPNSPVLSISLNAEITATKLKEELEKIWKSTQKTPQFSLSKSISSTKLENLFETKEVSHILKQGNLILKELQSKHPFSFSNDFIDLVIV